MFLIEKQLTQSLYHIVDIRQTITGILCCKTDIFLFNSEYIYQFGIEMKLL